MNLFIIVPIIGLIIFGITIFLLISMFNPKWQSKFIKRQLHMHKQMLSENEDLFKELSKKSAEISREGTEIKYSSIGKGLKKGFGSSFCKHCGRPVDIDAKFCSSCGKEI